MHWVANTVNAMVVITASVNVLGVNILRLNSVGVNECNYSRCKCCGLLKNVNLSVNTVGEYVTGVNITKSMSRINAAQRETNR